MSGQQIKEKGKVFRDPVHRLIRIEREDQFILDLINTPEFQRLRRVRQLGVSNLTYHGAEHSRFAHSLGVFSFAQRIIATLRRRYGRDHAVTKHLETHARVAKAAALLHDIGHGPFSHMIERAAGSNFDHEAMTARLITQDNGEGSISSILGRHGIVAKDVADVISKVYPHRLIVDIVSSQLDADRMDYLLRDSLMTGVEYGVYDAEWLLNAMCVGRDPGAADPSNGNLAPPEHAWRLCLDRDRGLYAAEQLILARHHMMLQVYMHRVTRGYEVMLLNLFQHVAGLAKDARLLEATPASVVAYFQSGIKVDRDQWLLFDETAMVAAFQVWSRDTSAGTEWRRRMSRAFLNRERILRAHPIGKLGTEKTMRLQEGLSKANLTNSVDWGLDNGKHLPYKGVYYGAAVAGGDEEQSTLSILLSDGNPDSKGRPIEQESSTLRVMDNDAQAVTRLYIDVEKLSLAEPVLRELKISQGGAA